MRFDLIDRDSKLFGFVDSDKNPQLETVGIFIVATSEGSRYFRYNGIRTPGRPANAFIECEVMSAFFSEIEHDDNIHTTPETG